MSTNENSLRDTLRNRRAPPQPDHSAGNWTTSQPDDAREQHPQQTNDANTAAEEQATFAEPQPQTAHSPNHQIDDGASSSAQPNAHNFDLWIKQTVGHFAFNETQNMWEELTDNNTIFRFTETHFANGEVVLHDPNRDLSVLLTESEYFWAPGRQRGRGEGWSKLGDGHWENRAHHQQQSHQSQPQHGDQITLHIRTTTQPLGEVHVSPNTRVRLLKFGLQSMCGFAAHDQVLVHRGKLLQDPVLLADCGVQHNDSIFVVRSPQTAAHFNSAVAHAHNNNSTTNDDEDNNNNNDSQNRAHNHRVWQGKRQCRICLGGENEGHLFSPCRCSGTVGFVHAGCLNTWRRTSPNPFSFVRCDQCGYEYRVVRAQFAQFLLHPWVISTFSLLLAITLLVSSALVCHLIRFDLPSHFYHAVAWTPSWRMHHNFSGGGGGGQGGLWRVIPVPGAVLPPWLCDGVVCGGVLCGLGGAGVAWYRHYQRDPEHFWQHLVPWIGINVYVSGMPVMRLVALVGLVVAWREVVGVVVLAAKMVLVRWGERVLDFAA